MTEENTTPICGEKKTIPRAQTCGCTAACCRTQAIQTTTGTITLANRLDHLLARFGWRRSEHRVEPGLYRLGDPNADSPVFASANYSLSFDALRSPLAGIDAWILVLDTKGINVWCAAGKGTFGTDELVRRIESSDLAGIVSHRTIIVPQLGAPGVSWVDVAARTKFTVEYGPVRADDLPEYLKTHTATPAMRRVEFSLRDRLVLTPVEFMHAALPTLAAAAVLWFLAGPVASLAALSAVLAGTVLFPLLLPVLPTRDFSTKGMILGMIVSLPFAYVFGTDPNLPVWAGVLSAAAAFLLITPVISYLALNFTGCTPFTSRTGVKKEIFSYIKVMAGMAALGVISGIILGVSRILGVI